MEENKINWRQIFVTAFITGLITVISGFILFKIQEREPRLTYSSIQTIPFEGSNKIVGIYNVKLANEGKRDIKDVVCVIRIDKANVDQYKVSTNPANIHSETQKDDTLTVKLSGLNPFEEATVSLLASSQSTLPKLPEVALRASGITGVEKSDKERSNKLTNLLFPVLAGVIATLILFGMLSDRHKKKFLGSQESMGKQAGNQRNILAYLCNLLGLREEEERYRGLIQEVEYWSESDRLALLAIESKENNLVEKILKLLQELTQYTSMAESSEAIVYFNIARVAAAHGKQSVKEEYLKKARRIAPKLIDKRLSIDAFSKSMLE